MELDVAIRNFKVADPPLSGLSLNIPVFLAQSPPRNEKPTAALYEEPAVARMEVSQAGTLFSIVRTVPFAPLPNLVPVPLNPP